MAAKKITTIRSINVGFHHVTHMGTTFDEVYFREINIPQIYIRIPRDLYNNFPVCL